MMKKRKRRGYRAGRGARKRKRGHGNRGGFGRGGTGKRGQHKGHFNLGKIGFNSKIKKPVTINLKQLDQLIRKLNKKDIDLNEFGIEKVIGGGKINFPIKLKVKMITEGAKRKIEDIGGSVELG